MINVYDVLKQNEAEAVEILKGVSNNTIEFAKWDEEKGHWVFALDECEPDRDEDDFTESECPWVRIEGYKEMVVAVKLNETKDGILILSVEDVYSNEDLQWVASWMYDDISPLLIFDSIGFWNNNKGF